jgi:molybdate transport system substrate-binding protein
VPISFRLVLAALAAFLWSHFVVANRAAAADVPTIAAASDLQFALEEAAALFRKESGRDLKLAFGSSGNFFRQIRQGAPFQLFFSADEKFVQDLASEGLTEGEGDLYALGRIVIITPRGSPVKPDTDLAELRAALADGRLKKFAIANPEHAPYGRRAEEALRHAGLWEALEGKLVLGENVSQAAQFALSGAAEAGIVAYSLALAPEVSARAEFELIPDDWHQPLRQRMALLKGSGETARLFYDFMKSPSGRGILKRYGFVLPGATM